jgi:hypothetical protein
MAYRKPASPFMASPFKNMQGAGATQQQAIPYAPGMGPEAQAPQAVGQAIQGLGGPVPTAPPVQGSATRSPSPQSAKTPKNIFEMIDPQKEGNIPQGFLQNLGAMGNMNPADMARLREEFRGHMDKALSRRQKSLDSMQQSFDNYKDSKRGIDWGPALGLSDMMNMGRTNQQAMYNQSSLRPESKHAKLRNLFNMQKQMDASEQGLLNAEMGAAKAQMGATGMGSGSQSALLRGLINMQRDKTRYGQRNELYDKKELDKDRRYSLKESDKFLTKVTGKMYENQRDLGNIKAGLQDGSLPRVNSVLASLSRLMGERGVLTEGDIGRQMYNSLALYREKIETFFAQNPADTPLPKEIIKPLKQTLNAAIETSRDRYYGEISSKQKLIQNNPLYAEVLANTGDMFKTSLDTVDEIFGSSQTMSTGSKKAGGAKPYTAEDLNKMSDAERKAVMKQLGIGN